MYEVIAEMEEAVKAAKGFSNNRLHFVRNDFKVLVDFGGEGNIQQAIIKLAFHSFLLICQALC